MQMPGDWQGLITNLAVLAATLMLWTIIQDNFSRIAGRFHAQMFGIVMGLGAIVLMSVPFALMPGLIFDCRVAMIANAGLFGGPFSALIAAVLGMAYRIYLGGIGVGAGCASIAASMMVGIVGYRLIRGRSVRPMLLCVFSVAAAVVNLAIFFVVPRAIWQEILPVFAPPFFALNFVATFMTALALRQEQRRRDLIETNRLYRTTIEALPDCLNVKDMAGRFLAVNPATAALMRSGTADALIGKTDFDFYTPEIAIAFRRDEERVLKGGKTETIDQYVAYEDGSHGWLSTLKVPLRDSEGRVVGLITHNRDITVQKQLQSELDATRERLNDAMNTMSDGLAIYDGHGVLVFCNRKYRDLFPRTADLRVPGARYVDILRAGVARGEMVVDRGHQLEDWIARRYRALIAGDGYVVQLADSRWMQIKTAKVKEGMLFIVTDITEQRNAENELKAAEAEYRALFENSVVGIYRSTQDGRMLRANPALVQMNGYAGERDLIEAMRDIAAEFYVDPIRRSDFMLLMERDGGVTDFVSEVYRHKTRERLWISETAWTVFDADQKVKLYEGTVINVTERKQAADRLADANTKLEQLASTDGLTGLSNRRVFNERLEIEFARRRRDGTELSLVMIDVDRFKAYNDTYGHLAGDDCLRFISRIFQTILKRPADLVCRYGGEELVAILPSTGAGGAYEIAETFRRAVKGLKIVHVGSEFGIVSISAGIATCTDADGLFDAEELVRRADRALYQAKADGRDRVLEAVAA